MAKSAHQGQTTRRQIRNPKDADCVPPPEAFHRLNFEPADFIDKNGEAPPIFKLTKDGLSCRLSFHSTKVSTGNQVETSKNPARSPLRLVRTNPQLRIQWKANRWKARVFKNRPRNPTKIVGRKKRSEMKIGRTVETAPALMSTMIRMIRNGRTNRKKAQVF
ncbi:MULTISPECIES: hypothetical protein [unclassified Serratia (in: enterobacteria)]|uniref:hypothetical protein n=1 Tax=unclassified Serratia (in: enterobacteria) TaxID=2647522 RepID=UPI000469D1CD|nr:MULTISPECIES: hypothetical protein [unclassified Serratia (in: enterobacteria)]